MYFGVRSDYGTRVCSPSSEAIPLQATDSDYFPQCDFTLLTLTRFVPVTASFPELHQITDDAHLRSIAKPTAQAPQAFRIRAGKIT